MDQQTDPGTGPRVTAEQMRDLSRLRRSSTDRYVAGVAGGLGRHFDVDPTIIRVVLAVLTLFGAAGLVVYVAVWLLVPQDGHDTAPVTVSPDVQRVALIGAAGIAALIVLGTPFTGHGLGLRLPIPLLVVLVLGTVVFSALRHRGSTTPPPPPWDGPVATTGGPVPTYAVPPPRPRRTGVVLFWPTLALIAIGLGVLGMLDVDATVLPSAYVALALAVTAVMLLVGAFVGRPGGLIALGLVASLALGLTTAVEASTDWHTAQRTISARPTESADVQDVYTVPNGRITLDLRQLRDASALDGRTIAAHLQAGRIVVELPADVRADVDGRLRFAGDIQIGDSEHSGLGPRLSRTLGTSAGTGLPIVHLDLEGRAGQIRVTQDATR